MSSEKRLKGESGEPVLKFRNYAPSSDDLKTSVVPEEALPDISTEVTSVQKQLAEEAEERGAAPSDGNDVDLLNLAPQKIDWDLKRDIAPKLEKLERRTQRAIAEIIRDRSSAK
eukprot:m.113460 g.113460  ORF g.113460 m.113460 type:complete len:114 (-) comp17084_c1_seq2:344-685(-)